MYAAMSIAHLLKAKILLQAGMEGLMTGLMKFDPERGSKLSTSLVWWIRLSVSAAAAKYKTVVEVPRNKQYAALRVRKQRSILESRLRRSPPATTQI